MPPGLVVLIVLFIVALVALAVGLARRSKNVSRGAEQSASPTRGSSGATTPVAPVDQQTRVVTDPTPEPAPPNGDGRGVRQDAGRRKIDIPPEYRDHTRYNNSWSTTRAYSDAEIEDLVTEGERARAAGKSGAAWKYYTEAMKHGESNIAPVSMLEIADKIAAGAGGRAAENYYRDIVKTEDRSSALSALTSLGDIALHQDRYVVAREVYSFVAAANDLEHSPRALVGLAVSYEGRGRLHEAEEFYRQAADMGHSYFSPLARERLGSLSIRNKLTWSEASNRGYVLRKL